MSPENIWSNQFQTSLTQCILSFTPRDLLERDGSRPGEGTPERCKKLLYLSILFVVVGLLFGVLGQAVFRTPALALEDNLVTVVILQQESRIALHAPHISIQK